MYPIEDHAHPFASATIHPNPVRDRFTLGLTPSENDDVRIEIRAIDGRLLRLLPSRHLMADQLEEIEIPVFNLAPGLYHCRILGKHAERSLPFVVQ